MNTEIGQAILDTLVSPIVFVDNDHVIRYMNKAARHRYYEQRGYSELVGKSIFACHSPQSREQILALHDRFMVGEDEIFLKVDKEGMKITVIAVRDTDGHLLGYYERFEPAVTESGGPNDS